MIVLLTLLAVTFVQLARSSSIVAQRAQEDRRQMLLYTEQLAAGSDRLTGAVRAYAATGQRKYLDDFRKELEVDRNRDRALEGLLRMDLTHEEQALLTRAKRNSDQLVKVENQAFAAVESGDTQAAIGIVYGAEFLAAKASIMQPIADCRRLLEQRMNADVQRLVARAGLLDDVALVILLLDALSLMAALELFYRRRVVRPLARVACSLNDLSAGKAGAAIGYQQDASEIGEVARSIEQYRRTLERLRDENEQLVRDESENARHRSVAQMVAGVAHEINTPLGIINTGADLITSRLSGLEADESVLEDLRDAGALISRNVARAHKLVQEFKKVSVNQITDIKEAVSLPEVVAETAHLFQVTCRQSRMQVVVLDLLPNQSGHWLGYPGSLSQVLLNLLSNAQRYAYPEGVGGKVEIALAVEDDLYRITVRDFGQGIPPENLTRVFDPFFTTGRGKGGSGLGLSIVHNIVTAHLRGSITVDSTPGTGTTVTLRLPREV